MNRIIHIVLIVCFLFSASLASAVTLKIATLSPEGSAWMEKMRAGAEMVKKNTDGRVTIKYYPGGVMGDDKAVLRKMRFGQVQGGAFVCGSLTDFFPDLQIYGLPMTFRSFAEVDYVRERMDSYIVNGLEEGGLVTFGIAEIGFAYLMSKSPIRKVSDLQNTKVWAPDNDKTVLESVKVFDVNPIQLTIADVRAGLQTGLVDTVATSPVAAILLQWHTQIEYLMDVPLMYIYGALAIDAKAFGRLKPGDQAIVRKALSAATTDLNRINREDNVEAKAALKNQGIEFIRPAPADIANWRERAEKVPEKLVQLGKISKPVLETFRQHLADFRGK
jgi:TRAP-type C4-dicarboxylate transport system substrate-binding protein